MWDTYIFPDTSMDGGWLVLGLAFVLLLAWLVAIQGDNHGQ